jgi:hypothetical protein
VTSRAENRGQTVFILAAGGGRFKLAFRRQLGNFLASQQTFTASVKLFLK